MLNTTSFKNQKVAIAGLSVEGLDSTKFFLQDQAHITCLDIREKDRLGDIYHQLAKLGVSFSLGANYLDQLKKFDLIVRTPGMALFLPELIRVKQAGVAITSSTKLFFDLCPAKIIGVTGTKGKGTTVTLIEEILTKSGHKTFIGGNVGQPLLSQVRSIKPTDKVVLELSSFQLEDLTKSPHIAVVLNITSDHLQIADPLTTNYHISQKHYFLAKTNLVKYQAADDYCVINADYDSSLNMAKQTMAKTYYFSKQQQVNGAYVDYGQIIRLMDGKKDVICSTNQLQLRGKHNWENILAAIVASSCSGGNLPAIKRTVTGFPGLEHRLEFFADINGVKYYNDSFSTTPETAIAAIQAFTEPIILIAGGKGKGLDYAGFAHELLHSSVKHIFLIGEMASAIKSKIKQAVNLEQFKKAPFRIWRGSTSLAGVVSQVKQIAQPGSVVLLSPACASFDMFKNYKDRGILFKKLVLQN